MTLKINSGEGGTNTTAVTTGNSGGNSGDAWGTVSAGSGGSIAYSNTQQAHGLLSYAMTPASGVACYMLMLDGSTGNSWDVEFYVYLTGYPSSETNFILVQTTGAVAAGNVNLTPTGKLKTQNAAGAVLGTMTNSVPLNAWTRIAFFGTCDAAAGTINVKMYAGDSTSPIETQAFTSVNTGSGGIGRSIVGKFTGTGTMTVFYLDDFRADLSVSTEAGPVTPPTVHAGGNQTVASAFSTVISAVDTAATRPAFTWVQLSPGSPTPTLSGSGSTRTFTAPTVSVSTNFTFQCSIVDVYGQTANESVVVTVTPATIATYTGTVTASGWTLTGSTAQAALSDNSDGSFLTSPSAPVGSLIDGTFATLTKPATDFVVQVRAKRIGSTSGTFIATLYEGSTQRAQVTGITIPDYVAWITITFVQANLAAIADASWGTGLRFTLAATAS